ETAPDLVDELLRRRLELLLLRLVGRDLGLVDLLALRLEDRVGVGDDLALRPRRERLDRAEEGVLGELRVGLGDGGLGRLHRRADDVVEALLELLLPRRPFEARQRRREDLVGLAELVLGDVPVHGQERPLAVEAGVAREAAPLLERARPLAREL